MTFFYCFFYKKKKNSLFSNHVVWKKLRKHWVYSRLIWLIQFDLKSQFFAKFLIFLEIKLEINTRPHNFLCFRNTYQCHVFSVCRCFGTIGSGGANPECGNYLPRGAASLRQCSSQSLARYRNEVSKRSGQSGKWFMHEVSCFGTRIQGKNRNISAAM